MVFPDEAEEVALIGFDVPFFAGPDVFPPVAGDAEGSLAAGDGGGKAGIANGAGLALVEFDGGGDGRAKTAEGKAAREGARFGEGFLRGGGCPGEFCGDGFE